MDDSYYAARILSRHTCAHSRPVFLSSVPPKPSKHCGHVGFARVTARSTVSITRSEFAKTNNWHVPVSPARFRISAEREEDCLRGWNGSGTNFFGWCNLRCVFCREFRDQPVRRRRRADERPRTRRHHARSPGDRLPRRRFRHPRARRPANPRSARNRHRTRFTFAARLQHLGLRQPRKHSLDGRRRRHLHARFQTLGRGALPKYLVAGNYAEAARAVVAAMHAQVGELKVDVNGLAFLCVVCWSGISSCPVCSRTLVKSCAGSPKPFRPRYLRQRDRPILSRPQSRNRTALRRDQPPSFRSSRISRLRTRMSA